MYSLSLRDHLVFPEYRAQLEHLEILYVPISHIILSLTHTLFSSLLRVQLDQLVHTVLQD